MNPRIRKVISNLEANGCDVTIRHLRHRIRREGHDPKILAKGGSTIMTVSVPPEALDAVYLEKAIVVKGDAHCDASDCYNRTEGTTHAFRRMMDNLRAIINRENVLKLVTPAS